jgi:SOS-response transcriptional repressor LexA
MAIGLTSRQATVFDAIKTLSAGTGIMPTFQEIMDATGISSKSVVHYLLRGIEERGLIRRKAARTRAIEIVEDAYSRIELARQNAALRAQVASLTADNEALQRTVARMCAAVNEITDPDTIWCAIDGVHDFDASLDDYAAAVSKAQRAEWDASK